MAIVAAAGYIFFCSDATEPECIAKGLFRATTPNFQAHIDHGTAIFLYNNTSRELKGLWKARYNASVSINPSAFGGAFTAQQAVQRVAHCTPAPLAQIQGIVNFWNPGRITQDLTAQQVTALSLLLSLRTISKMVPATQGGIVPAASSVPGSSAASAADKPSANCRVTHSAAAEKAKQSAAAEMAAQPAVVEKVTQSAAAEKVIQLVAAKKAYQSSAALATAKGNSTKQPFAFHLGSLKGKAGSAGGPGKHKRSLSLASVLEDVFEEVINTPPSSKRKRKRRQFGSTKAKSGGEATPAIDLTASDNEAGAEAVANLSSPSKPPPQEAPSPPPPALSSEKAQRQAAEAPAVVPNSSAAASSGPSAALPAAQELPKQTARRASGQPEAPLPPPEASEPAPKQSAVTEAAALKQPGTRLQPADNAPTPSEDPPPPPPPPPLEDSQPEAMSSAGITSAVPKTVAPKATVLAPSPGSGLICACSAQEADESFNRLQLPLPQQLRAAHPGVVIAQGTKVFLHNADTRRLLGPFYAMQTRLREDKVLVTEREPVQALREVDILEKLTAKVEHLSDLGPVIESSTCGQISRVFETAAIPNRLQPYRMLGEKLGGAVFVCSAGTVQSCLQMGLLGMMQDTFVPIVQHISVGMPVFLFNHSDRTLLGPLSAISSGGMYIDEKAWARPGHRSQWPAQVRIAVHHPIIALQEKVFKPLIKSAYYNSSTFHFDLTTAEALRLLDAFTHRQVMYHQHLQHRQGHAFFVPPAMCQQLLEAARRACRPPPPLAQQITRQPQQQLPHSNAYLAVLESGLSTQKKPPRKFENAPPPGPSPLLSEILGREPGEIESEQMVQPGGKLASSSAAVAADAKEAAASAAQEREPAMEDLSGLRGPANDTKQSGKGDGALLLEQSLSLQGEEGEPGTGSAAAEQGKQAEIGVSLGSRLLERFDAARHAQRTPSGTLPKTGGAPALGAVPAKPSPLGRQQVPLLSPLMLASAPSHTPFLGAASSAPAAPAHSLSFGQVGQLCVQAGTAQQASAELSPVQGTRPEEADATNAAGAASSFTFQVPVPPPRTPPSFARLLQEYASIGSKSPVSKQLEQTPGLASKRSRRKKKLKESIGAVVAPDARSDNEAPDRPDAPADQAAGAVPAEIHALLQSSMPDVSALGEAPATAAARTLALASSTAPPVADRSETGHLAPVAPSGPRVLSNCRKGKVSHALAHPQSSTEGQQLGSSNQPPSLGGGACPEQHAACDALLDTSLVGVIQEAAQAGRELPPKRQRRLALALQKAATAASVLHRALQAAGNILSADLEGRQLGAQSLTLTPARVPPASARAEAAQPGNASGPMPAQAVSDDPSSALVVVPSRAARPAPQLAATGKRSRLANESSAAESGDGAGKAKRQKRMEPATPLASAAQLARLLSSAAGSNDAGQPEQRMRLEQALPTGRPAVQLANRSSAAGSDGARAAKKQKGPDTAAPMSSAAAPLPSIPAEQTPMKPRMLMRSNQQLLGRKFAPCGPRGKPVKQTVQEAALSALKRLRHVAVTAEAQAAEAAGCASEAEGAIDAAPTEAPAAIDVAMGAPETPGSAPQVDKPSDIPGIAFEDSAGQAPATDGARGSPPPGPPPSPPAEATFLGHAFQPGSGQPEPPSPVAHPGAVPMQQLCPPQRQPRHQQVGMAGQVTQVSQQGRAPDMPRHHAPNGAPPQHGPPQHGPLLGMSLPFSGAPQMGAAVPHLLSQQLQQLSASMTLAPHGMGHRPPQQGLPLPLYAHSGPPLQPQHNGLGPWQQQQHMQLQMLPPQGAPRPPLGPPFALQQPFPSSHPQLQLQGPGPWLHQQRPGMLLQHSQQPWGPNGQPGCPPAHLPLPMQPQLQPGAPFGPPVGHPPAHAPPLQLQPYFSLPASAQPPQLPRPEQTSFPPPQPVSAATSQQAQRHFQQNTDGATAVQDMSQRQMSPVHPRAEQAAQHYFVFQPVETPVQAVHEAPRVSAGAPALQEEAATPSNARLALPGPTQAGMNGDFQFRAGQVGSAVVQFKNKRRRMQLTQLQKELQSHRARFLLWHERELHRAKATGKRKVVKAKHKEVEAMTLQHGDPETLQQVKAAGKAVLLEMASGSDSAKSGTMSGAAGEQGVDTAVMALANGTAEGHMIMQATPRLQSVGAKRKHLQNGHNLSKLVAFDTNVYMGNNAKDPKVITQVLKRWSLISPAIIVLVPIVVMSELNKLATFKSKIGELATAGLKILQTVLDSKIAHVQLPDELPEGCTTNRIKDDGILDCLRHFKEAGYHIFLCTRDRQFACRSQAQGIESVPPDVLAMRPEYPLQVEMTPMPMNKRRKTAQDAAAQLLQAPVDAAQLPQEPANAAQLLQVPANGAQLPQVPQHEFIAL